MEQGCIKNSEGEIRVAFRCIASVECHINFESSADQDVTATSLLPLGTPSDRKII
jgi:hypothetical protein